MEEIDKNMKNAYGLTYTYMGIKWHPRNISSKIQFIGLNYLKLNNIHQNINIWTNAYTSYSFLNIYNYMYKIQCIATKYNMPIVLYVRSQCFYWIHSQFILTRSSALHSSCLYYVIIRCYSESNIYDLIPTSI